jgi:hypothetical protein
MRPKSKMQALAGEMKAEVRATLTQHGITKFVIKPVKRKYAFELVTIPRKEQWVLKVKFAAASSHLPLGLTGKTKKITSFQPPQAD